MDWREKLHCSIRPYQNIRRDPEKEDKNKGEEKKNKEEEDG